MSKRILALITMIAVVSIALAACGGSAEPAPAPTQRSSPPAPPPADTPVSAAADTPTPPPPGCTPVPVSLQDPGGSGSYMFGPSDFTFSAGECISFALNAETEFHTFTIEGLGIDVSIDAGSPETLTFSFDTPGEYDLICIPHESLGMVGTVTVR